MVIKEKKFQKWSSNIAYYALLFIAWFGVSIAIWEKDPKYLAACSSWPVMIILGKYIDKNDKTNWLKAEKNGHS